MALTPLQQAVMLCLSKNRSESSYLAGGAALNKDWPRLSDDLDVFHDADEEINETANADMSALESAGFSLSVDVRIFGCVEARVWRNKMESTIVQWMSETKTRFFPLIRDLEWGMRLHPADLAVNKVLAACSRRKARDHYDLVSISKRFCPLGPLVLAAAGKPPYFSPQKIIDNLRRNGLSISDSDLTALRGIEKDMTPEKIRDVLIQSLDQSEAYIATAPIESVGILTLDVNDIPTEIKNMNQPGVNLRIATDAHEPAAQLPDADLDFGLR